MDLNGRTLTEALQRKWAPIVEHADLPRIDDPYRKAVTTILLENQEEYLAETAPTNNAGGGEVTNWDPILISLVRRAMPNLIAFDIAGVQPMTGPTGLIFAMRSHYAPGSPAVPGAEALGLDEADTTFSGDASGAPDAVPTGGPQDPLTFVDPFAGAFGGDDINNTGIGMSLGQGEALGDGAGAEFAEMSFSIEKTTVTARTRALKAEYTTELQQDLRAVHGLDAETELANILSSEILAESTEKWFAQSTLLRS